MEILASSVLEAHAPESSFRQCSDSVVQDESRGQWYDGKDFKRSTIGLPKGFVFVPWLTLPGAFFWKGKLVRPCLFSP